MASSEGAVSNRIDACNAARAIAYEAARTSRELAFKAALAIAKDEYSNAIAAADADKIENAKIRAALRAKYIADYAYAQAEATYQAAIEKAEVDYVESLRFN